MLPEPSTDVISEITRVEAAAGVEDNACFLDADRGVLCDLFAFVLIRWRRIVVLLGASANIGRASQAFRHGCEGWSDCINPWSINVNTSPELSGLLMIIRNRVEGLVSMAGSYGRSAVSGGVGTVNRYAVFNASLHEIQKPRVRHCYDQCDSGICVCGGALGGQRPP